MVEIDNPRELEGAEIHNDGVHVQEQEMALRDDTRKEIVVALRGRCVYDVSSFTNCFPLTSDMTF